jgi:hypothetical protein
LDDSDRARQQDHRRGAAEALPRPLFSVRLRDHDVLLYLLPEHKSGEERGLVLQELRYALNIWVKWADEHPTVEGLPPIIPVLFHHGDKPWRGPTSLRVTSTSAPRRGAHEGSRTRRDHRGERCLVGVERAGISRRTTNSGCDPRRSPTSPKLTVLCMRFLRFQDPTTAIATLERWQDLIAAVHPRPQGTARFAE